MKLNKLIIIIAIAILTTTAATTGASAASKGSSDLDQCRNGGIGNIAAPCNNLGSNSSWVNGNLNGQQAHYAEGHTYLINSVKLHTHTYMFNIS